MLPSAYDQILDRVAQAAVRSGRKPEEVFVLPVSKGQPLKHVESFLKINPSCKDLGENYIEELCAKKAALVSCSLRWHYLGRLQSRKIPEIVQHASVLHAVARRKELEILAKSALKEDLRFYVQFNVSKEATKGGFELGEAEQVLQWIQDFRLDDRMEGLMTMASPLESNSEDQVESEFASLREIRDRVFPEKGLSMGMSSDFELAIKHGATCVRLGSVLFGARV